MIGGERSMYWIKYKLFYVLVYIANPKLIGIKAYWFGFINCLLLMCVHHDIAVSDLKQAL